MAVYKNKPDFVGLSDPTAVRQTEAMLAQSAAVAKGKVTVTSAGEIILPSTTLSVGTNSITTTTSANNSPSDTVTVYSTQGAIYASSIDQTINQTVVNRIGVNSIIAGDNITITSTGASGTGVVTINATGGGGNGTPGGSNTQIQFNDGNAFGGNTGFTFNKTTGIFASPFLAGNGNGLSNIQGANVSGAVSSATSATTAGTVTTAAQSNITSIGTLTGLTSNGIVNFANTSNVTLGSIANLHISGGTNGYVLQTNGSGGLTWTAQTGGSGNGTPGGANTEVQYNDAGTFGASAGFTFNNTTNTLSATNITATANITGGNLTTGGSLSVTGNANIGNIGTAGVVTATGNVRGGNINTGGLVSATGNVIGGNLVTGGALSVTGNANVGNIGAAAGVFTTVTGSLTTAAQPNITSLGTLTSVSVSGNANIGNIGTAGIITATGNITGGNIITSGNVSATGNVTAANFIGSGSGTPTVTSATNLDLSATSAVRVVGGGTFRLPSLTTAQIANLIPANGAMIYNSSVNKFQGYENGAWANII
jgi:hypothetical protein